MRAPRALSRYDLLQESNYVPQLLISRALEATPPETLTEERTKAAQTWQAMQADPEQALNDRIELERRERALVASRKQVFLARGEAEGLRTELLQARDERLRNPMVYSLGALAAVSFAGWIFQRRQLLALREGAEGVTMPYPVLSSRVAFPPAVESTTNPEFESDLDMQEDEAEQWVAPSSVATPASR
ncbi:MAG: hypothetical protein ABI907_10095 [Ramlibacter sp.]